MENDRKISSIIKFIKIFKFMESSLSSLAVVIYSSKCKDYKSCLEYVEDKDELLMFSFLKYNKNHTKHFKESKVKRFANIYKEVL